MHFTTAILLPLALSVSVLAQSVDEDDVPRGCQVVCQDMVNQSATCRRSNNGNNGDGDETDSDDDDDNDRQYISCMCDNNTWQAQTLLPNCAACVAQLGNGDGDYDDVRDLMRACNFATPTTWTTPGAAAATGAPTVQPSSGVIVTPTPTPSSGSGSSGGSSGNDNNNNNNGNNGNNGNGQSNNNPTQTGSAPVQTETGAAANLRLVDSLGAAGIALAAGAAMF